MAESARARVEAARPRASRRTRCRRKASVSIDVIGPGPRAVVKAVRSRP
jgi:hypothetical protein